MRTEVALFGLLFLTGCAHHYTAESVADPYGFFYGIWHGFIFPFSVVGWLLFDGVQIIGRPNSGLWYYVGFGVGLLALSKSR
jgi:hypothetical protein